MAEAKKPKKRMLKNTETVRERASKEKKEPKTTRRLSDARTKAATPLKKVANIGRKEYYLPMPDNKFGRFLNKRRRVIPKYFRESWHEVRQVNWPSNKKTFQLTLAVFAFTAILVSIVSIVDYGLDKIFQKLLLG